jgi:hypothetical protein
MSEGKYALAMLLKNARRNTDAKMKLVDLCKAMKRQSDIFCRYAGGYRSNDRRRTDLDVAMPLTALKDLTDSR